METTFLLTMQKVDGKQARAEVYFIATSQLPVSEKVSFDDKCAAPSVLEIKL